MSCSISSCVMFYQFCLTFHQLVRVLFAPILQIEVNLCIFIFRSGQSGFRSSKYCTFAAKFCFGESGQSVFISFNPHFKKAPKVVIGLTLVDTHKDHNVRVRASVTSVSKNGFTVRFKPWDTSITYQIGVNWMACP